MDIAKKYDPSKVEQKWYQYWMEKGFFHSEPDEREPYTIVIPPPNVTGVLHMGHILNNTIQDILIRRARMLGKNACWVPGTDHASIATEAKVVEKLREEGIDKYSLDREEFLKHAWEWKEKHGGIILEQLKKLGASCDWNRTKFTMDDDMYESVIKVFIDLYEKGYVYRGVRMVNWDPQAKTAISDEEVNYKEVRSKLYYIKYPVDETDQYIEIATTRPETILGDTAVCVHPEDTRYTHLYGKEVIVPVINRKVPLILDEYVDKEFGSGALKITPAHDENDHEIGLRHKLKIIDIFNDDGSLNENAEIHIGEDRFEARENFVKDLEKEGYLVKVEDYTNSIGFSERTDAVIEPKLSTQWFCRMNEMARPALENVMNNNIRFHPPKFKNTYKHWMENIKDWCISRQLWWGQRIPAYYLPDGNYVVAENETEALKKAKRKTGNYELTFNDLKQDPDVLDTWFSSWLWPISVFDGIRNPDNKDINYYYPTDDLVTAPEILFFWVARMIMAGYEYRDEKPFGNVYLTGVVRDNQRRKMSKSLGNSPDPLRLINQYGADGVRVGMLLCSPAGNDLLFDESLTEQGRNFGNKIWNAFRLVKNWEVDGNIRQPEHSKEAIEWFRNRLNKAIEELDKQFEKFRLSDALMNLYRLFWDEFSSWYLEIVKPAYKQPVDRKTYELTLSFFEQLMELLHPIMPFITEEIWQLIYDRGEDESITITEMPGKESYETSLIDSFEKVKEIITSVRNIRKDKDIPYNEALSLQVNGEHMVQFDSVIRKLANIDTIEEIREKPENAVSFMVRTTEYYIPVENVLDTDEEINKLEEELEYTRGFLQSVMKKLNNEKFVGNAPKKVVDREKKKKEDAEQKIKTLEERINSLKK
ncbi:MAG: valine--tRNA ligase [Bacteroidales bacterium]|nr:valine--tRNA ligase [Bacteroidales bacterium]